VDVIDKTIPTPMYYQLQQILREKIEKGVWKPGDMIPTEKEVMEKYNVSRTTARQAILALVNDGYLSREKSKGTIVARSTGRMKLVGSLISFSEEISQKGMEHFSHTLDQRVVSANSDIAAKLQINENDPVYYLKRIRYLEGRPYIMDEHLIPYRLVPGIELKYQDNSSLYQFLEGQYGLDLHHGQITFEPVTPPSKEMMDLLEIHSNTNLIFAERIVYNEKEVAMDFFKAYIRGKFSINVLKAIELNKE
jgi:GntR family transcriptional regulator